MSDILASIAALTCADRLGKRPWRWVSDGIEWVTDAAWIAWRPWSGITMRPEEVNAPSEGTMQVAAKIRADVERALAALRLWPLADVAIPPTPAPETCPSCKGSRTNDEPDAECHECGGTGELTCDLDHEHDCDECDGLGVIKNEDRGKPCATCDGTGLSVLLPPVSVPWAGGMWSGERLRVLRDHGAFAARTDVELASEGLETPLVFRCGEVSGIMMARTA